MATSGAIPGGYIKEQSHYFIDVFNYGYYKLTALRHFKEGFIDKAYIKKLGLFKGNTNTLQISYK